MRAVSATSPAFVADDLATIVAQNDLHVTLFDRVTGLDGWAGNIFWCWFVSQRWRHRVLATPAQQADIGRAYVAYLRVVVAQRDYDATATALVAGLRAGSAEFARMWDEHRVSTSYSSAVTVLDRRVGRLDLDYALTVSSQSRQRLHSLHAVPGTPTQERLTRLIELAQDSAIHVSTVPG
jgi:hypothetical protein